LDGLLPSTVSTADIAKLWPLSDHTKIHYFPDKKFRIGIFQNFYIETKFWNFWGNYFKKNVSQSLALSLPPQKKRELGDIRYEKKNFGNCSL
jgi:hypothetical protein